MACNPCETAFRNAQSVVVTVSRSGTTALVYVQNQGRNIVLLRRILLCYATSSAYGMLYLRPPPDATAWQAGSPYLEPGLTVLFYTVNNVSPGLTIQAQAEYVELDGRSRSCPETF